MAGIRDGAEFAHKAAMLGNAPQRLGEEIAVAIADFVAARCDVGLKAMPDMDGFKLLIEQYVIQQVSTIGSQLNAMQVRLDGLTALVASHESRMESWTSAADAG
jgi:hypothetical protein